MAKPWEEDWGTQAAATTPTTPPWEIDWDVESNLPPWEQNWGQGSPALVEPDVAVVEPDVAVVEPEGDLVDRRGRARPARTSLYRNVPIHTPVEPAPVIAQETPPVEVAPVIAQETPPSDGYVTKELIDSLIMEESSGNPFAVSPVGAEGLGQVMPRTAKNPGFGVEPLKDAFDPVESRRFATD